MITGFPHPGTVRTGLDTTRLIVGLVVLLVLQQVFTIPGDSVIRQTLHDTAHVPWFCMVTLCLRLLLRNWRRAAPVAVAIAAGSEALQHLTGRDADTGDLLRNLLGGLLAFSLHASRGGQAFTKAARIASALLVLAAIAPLSFKVLALVSNHRAFPVLLDADSRLSTALVRAGTRITREGTAPAVLQLIIDDQPWPGMHLTDPVGDWQGYSYLVCDCAASPGPPMDVFAGVLLRPGNGITSFALATADASGSTVRWPVAELLQPGDTVHDVFIYTAGEYAGRTLGIRRLWLE